MPELLIQLIIIVVKIVALTFVVVLPVTLQQLHTLLVQHLPK